MANSSMLVLPTTTAPASRETVDHGGVVGRSPTLEDAGRAGGGDAPGAEVVLQGHRHPGQRPGVLAAGHRPVHLGRLGPGPASAGDQVEGVDLPVARLRWRPGAPPARRGPSGPPSGRRWPGRPTGRGALTAPRRGCGAPGTGGPPPRAPGPAPRPGRGTGCTSSGRSTLVTAMAWAVGATPARSSDATSAAWSSTSASWPVNRSSSSSVSSSRARRGHVGHVGPGEPVGRPSVRYRHHAARRPGRPAPCRRTPPPAPRSGARPSPGWPRGSCARGRPARGDRRPTPAGRRRRPVDHVVLAAARATGSDSGSPPDRAPTPSAPSNKERTAASGVPG